MSCVFVITPFVISNWSILTSLVGGAAARHGYRMMRSATNTSAEINAETSVNVELEIENSEVMTEQMKRGESVVLTKEDIKIVLSLDHLNRLKASVQGTKSVSKDKLRTEGQEFLDSIIQQYAYQKVMTELKDKGFSLVNEQVEKDGRIRIKIRKYE